MAGNAAHWRDLPDTFGKWTAVHARFRRWSRNGVWEGLFHPMADTPDFEYVMIDSTLSKVHDDASGAQGGLNVPPSDVLAAALQPSCTPPSILSVLPHSPHTTPAHLD